MDLAEKDMRLIQQLAQSTDCSLALVDVNIESLRRASGQLGGERDFSELATYLRSLGPNRSQRSA